MELFIKVGKTKYIKAPREDILLAAGEIAVRDACERPSQSVAAPSDAAAVCRALVGHHEREQFGVLWLNVRNGLICAEILFHGTIDGATVYPREVVKRALELNAVALILTHNHPSGSSSPSEADRHITAKLVKALALIEVRLLDHVIVGADTHHSMAEAGTI